ncbi:MAG: hypothetical protein JO112_13360, partial [Planctomycetes bacterium]|nr:hypothetical protein [Planctomycetota bacterium]
GDEAAQADIYNEAASDLPRFKPATDAEVARRCRARDFDPESRLFAEDQGRVVGYCTYHANGRVSYPWCRPGSERAAEPLFQQALEAMRHRGQRSAFAAYRKDWPVQQSFFLEHGFRQAREMINFVLDLAEMPTALVDPRSIIFSLRPEDFPDLLRLAPQALRVASARELENHLGDNPYFDRQAVFLLREPNGRRPVAAGVLILNRAYADPRMVDPNMPCFRLGAFGTEGMQTKRIQGLFSFLTAEGPESMAWATTLLEHAASRMEQAGLDTLAAQVPSDVPHLLRFYEQVFRRQGSFPVLERIL